MTEARFTTVCPECGASLMPVGPYQSGQMQAGQKPEAVVCTGEDKHRFPVLEHGTTSGGQARYALGPQIKD